MTDPQHDSAASESTPAPAAAPGSGGVPTNPADAQTLIQSFRQWGMTSQKYVIEGQLAEGGMGVIYKVSDRGLQRQAALKVIVPDLLHDASLLSGFVREAQITGQLEHPNIIPVHDIGVMDDQRPFFSMKLIQGETLIEIIGKLYAKDPVYEETYSLFKLLTICRKVCDAVAFAHAKDVIHRDIKPDNIIVGDYGEVLLLDWGLARQDRHAAPSSEAVSEAQQGNASRSAVANLTQFGDVKGTPSYMSPEQAMGVPDMITKRTDIFLLGATLYTVATLTMPYTGRSVQAILEQAERGRVVPPQRRARQRHIPDALNHIIVKCMAFDPDDRYASVADLIHDLDAFMAGETVTKHHRFAKDAVLMQEGDAGREAYVILSGAVQVSKLLGDQSVSLMQLGVGDTVGEMALISEAPRSATVKAQEDTEVVVINAELMQQALEKLPPWLGQIVQALANRLRQADEHVHPLMQGDGLWHTLRQLEMVYPVYAQPLPGNGSDDQHQVMALPFDATVQEIASNLCLDTLVITQVLQGLCQHGMLQMLDDLQFTIPHYEHFCQFVDYARDAMGYTAHLKHTPQVNGQAGETDRQRLFQPLLDALKHDARRRMVERPPSF